MQENRIPEHLKHFVKITPVQLIRQFVVTMLLIFPNFFLLLTVFFLEPYSSLYAYLLLPIIILLDIWGLYFLLRNPQRIQIQFMLFRSWFWILTSIGLFIAAQKIIYLMIGVRNPAYAVVSGGGYILFILVFVKLHRILLIRGGYDDRNISSNKFPLYAMLPILGVVGGNLLLGITTARMGLAIVSTCLMLLSILFEFIAVVDSHRYALIRKYLPYVNSNHKDKL